MRVERQVGIAGECYSLIFIKLFVQSETPGALLNRAYSKVGKKDLSLAFHDYVNKLFHLFITGVMWPISGYYLWITLGIVWITFNGISISGLFWASLNMKPLFVVT